MTTSQGKREMVHNQDKPWLVAREARINLDSAKASLGDFDMQVKDAIESHMQRTWPQEYCVSLKRGTKSDNNSEAT